MCCTSITNLMVSRLMLNLRREPQETIRLRSTPRSSTIVHDVSHETELKDDFTATIIGNLGQPISFLEEPHDRHNATGRRNAYHDEEDVYSEVFELDCRSPSGVRFAMTDRTCPSDSHSSMPDPDHAYVSPMGRSTSC